MTFYMTRVLRKLACGASLAIACSVAYAATAQAEPISSEERDQYIEDAMATWRVPGVAVAIVTPDSEVLLNGYGVTRQGSNTPVDEDTVFAIGSNGKSFTAVMLGALRDEGVIDFNDPIIDHLPGFRLRDHDAMSRLTFADALGHVSGLPEQATLGAWYLLGAEEDELIRLLGSIEPAAPFRERFAYNNAMFAVAGAAGGAATGKSYHTLINDYVLRPLKMRRSSTTLDITKGRNTASPHAYVDGEPTPVPYHPVRGASAAGSMNSTARDMSRYVQMMMNGGSLDETVIMSPETSSEIQKFRHAFVDGEMENIKQLLGALEDPGRVKALGYGLGIAHLVYNGSTYYLHGGGIDGMTSWMMWSPEDEIGIVVLTNAGNLVFPALLSFAIANTYIGLPLDDALGRMAPARDQIIAQAQPPVAETALPALVSNEALAGEYANVNGSFTLSNTKDGLTITLGKTGYKGALTHVNGAHYWVDWKNPALPPLAFVVETAPSGKISGLRETPTHGQILFSADRFFGKAESDN